MVAPCLNCKERVLGCHATCAGYLKYREERENIIAGRAAENSKYYKAPVSKDQRPSKSYKHKEVSRWGKVELQNVMATEL